MTTFKETVEARRKRLLWRASHRGTRELDLMLGGFVKRHIGSFGETELGELEAIVDLPDPELMGWILGDVPVPQRQVTATLKALLNYRP
ncbi:MAG: succinate dehydrogenase assembly factor 2 [Parvibaculaceae bacterium]